MYRWIEKNLNRWLKAYSIVPLISVFTFNSLVYWGTMKVTEGWHHYDFTLSFDRVVPFVPEWVYIYLVCYLFWAINYIMSAWFGKERFYQFVTADLLSRVICCIFFLAVPTTNIRPEIAGEGMTMEVMCWLYEADQPSNLFPSIHCLVSWFSYIAIRGRKEIPKWYRAFSCMFALAVVASTQYTKQHYIVDAVGGVLLAELCWWFAVHTSACQWIKKFFENINDKISKTGKTRE